MMFDPYEPRKVTPTQLLQDALVDISDAERRQALHITPATGTLIRRLREVTTALSETLDGVYEAYRHLGEDTDGARNARELFGPMTGITNPAAWIALLIAEHRAEAEAEATPPQRPTDGDGGVWGTYVAYLHNLESAFEAAGLRQTETPDEGPVMSALDHARDVLREWESGDRYYPGSEDRLYSALHGLVAARGAAEALPPTPGPCPAEAYSWDFYRPEQTDPYWMRCRKSEGHDGEHQSDEGAQWSEPTDPSSIGCNYCGTPLPDGEPHLCPPMQTDTSGRITAWTNVSPSGSTTEASPQTDASGPNPAAPRRSSSTPEVSKESPSTASLSTKSPSARTGHPPTEQSPGSSGS